MLPLPVTVMAPPSLRTGPVVGVEMVRGDPEHCASARSGAARAPRATSEAPASSEAREIRAPPLNVEMSERPSTPRACAHRPLFFTPMTPGLPKSNRFFTYSFYSQKDLFTCRDVRFFANRRGTARKCFGTGLQAHDHGRSFGHLDRSFSERYSKTGRFACMFI